MKGSAAVDQIQKTGKDNLSLLVEFARDPRWKSNGEIKGEKVCRMYTMEIETRLASKGTVEDVDGSPLEVLECLSGGEYPYKLDPR